MYATKQLTFFAFKHCIVEQLFMLLFSSILCESATCTQSLLKTCLIPQAIKQSGCDALIDVGVSYKRRAHSETWTDVKIELADQTQVTITGLSYDDYVVKLTATNNEHVSASSEILTINLATSE